MMGMLSSCPTIILKIKKQKSSTKKQKKNIPKGICCNMQYKNGKLKQWYGA